MLYRLEILDDALVLFQEVRAQVVYSPILFFFMAKIHARRGRMDQAMNEYRQLLRNLGVLKMRFECSVCGHKHRRLCRPLRRLRQLEQQPFPVQGKRDAGTAPAPGNRPWVGLGFAFPLRAGALNSKGEEDGLNPPRERAPSLPENPGRGRSTV